MSGQGTIVGIDENNLILSSTYSTVASTISFARGHVDTMKAEVTTALTQLQAVVDTWNPLGEDKLVDIDVGDIDTTQLDGQAFPSRPDLSGYVISNNWPTFTTPAPETKDYGDLDFSIDTPLVPDPVDDSFKWSDAAYNSDLWAALFNKVHHDIINGGTGLSDDVYNAILARESESRRVRLDKEYRAGLDALGARGFDMPTGVIAAFQAEMTRERMKIEQDAINAITIKSFDLATENTRFATDTAKDLEQLLRATFDAAQTRSLDAAKAAKQYVMQVYELNMKRYMAEWDGVKARIEALKSEVEAITSYNDGLIEVYKGQADVYEKEIQAIRSRNESNVQSKLGDVQAYATEIEAVKGKISGLVEALKAHLDIERLEVQAAIEEAKLSLDSYVNKETLAERAIEASANIAAQVVASALGAVNTSVGQSYSASEGKSESWGHSDHLSEAHNFAHEG